VSQASRRSSFWRLGIDRHVHVPTGIGRHDLKARIQKLKLKRDEVLQKHDRAALADVRREIKSNKRHLRRVIDRALRHQGADVAAKSD
jgi:chromosome segregation ATPase